jgi:hypothetical protein
MQMGCLHSAVEPQEKAALLRRFNSGQLRALLLTDAYGLGLDFKDVDVVLGVSCELWLFMPPICWAGSLLLGASLSSLSSSSSLPASF